MPRVEMLYGVLWLFKETKFSTPYPLGQGGHILKLVACLCGWLLCGYFGTSTTEYSRSNLDAKLI